MDTEAAYELITRDLQEVLGGEIIKKILTDSERNVKCYWGEYKHAFWFLMENGTMAMDYADVDGRYIQELRLQADVSSPLSRFLGA